MIHCQGTFQGLNGINLFYQSWTPDHQTQAVIAMVHGLGGHSGLFATAAKYLVSQGYAAYAFDLRGHGRSPGQRGYINSWAEFRDDLRAFLERIHQQRPGCPCFLWGHSLGGTIALDYALRSPDYIHGLLVTAPALGDVKVSPVKLTLGRLLSRVHPRFSMKLGFKAEWGSRDPAMLASYTEDPLRHEVGSARLATEFLATVRWIYQNAAQLQTPLLILHGSADRIVLPTASRDFFQRVMFADREHREYPGTYHDVFADLDYQMVLTDFGDWLERHLEGVPTCQHYAICAL
jgi:alpha-beta hydrolase superfamily lysophospholipase